MRFREFLTGNVSLTESAKSDITKIIASLSKDKSGKRKDLTLQLYTKTALEDNIWNWEYMVSNVTAEDAIDAIKKCVSKRVFEDCLGFDDDDEYNIDVSLNALKSVDHEFF